MLVINSEQTENRFLLYLPRRIRRYLYMIPMEGLEELRLRLGLPVALYYTDRCCYLTEKGQLSPSYTGCMVATMADISEGMELICDSSVYAVENEIKKGYITIPGGHRVGICGSVVEHDGKISNIGQVSGLNYRIAREMIGISNPLIPYICPDNGVRNTLIISPPQCGKTTLLRDVVRSLSERGKKISVIDERNELSAMHHGLPSHHLGVSSDVLEGAGKEEGMLFMLRSMSPDVIVTDELGEETEGRMLSRIIHSGVRLISTIHAGNRSELLKREEISAIYPYFQCFITLSRREGVGTVEEVYCVD